MPLKSKELTNEISPLMVVMLQNGQDFNYMAAVADNHNYLFRLCNQMLAVRLEGLESPKTKADFLLGVSAYQAITMSAFPEQPTFTHYPQETIAYKMANQIGSTESGLLVETGVKTIDEMAAQTPFLTEITTEVIERYTTDAGSKRIAMGGAATMLATHVAAEAQLAA